MPGFKYHVFLSHSTPEKPAVEELAVRLRREGFEPWLDKWNLVPGELCQVVMETALTDCATCAVFIGPSGFGVWQEEEMRAAIARRVNEARTVPNAKDRFRVIPVLLPNSERPERGLLPPFLAAATWVEFRKSLDDQDAFHRLVCGIRGVEPGAGLSGAAFEGACPYRGLEVFDVEHAPFFFGREALTEWLIVKLRASPSGQENRFLAILGASGSGKSSLARAGLIPAIKRGDLVGSAEWLVVILKPGRDPIESLAVALTSLDGARPSPVAVQGLMTGLQANENTLHLTTRLTLRDAPPARRLVLLVDQFEEVFTLCEDEKTRKALFDNLLYAATITGGQTIVLLTMRADFYGKCGAYPALATAMSDHQLLVGPMTEDELRRAIERPAQLAGGEFEPGLVEMLLQDVAGQPGALPLLQFALTELWQRREGRRLTVAAYRAVGGLQGALESRANEVLATFNDTERETCRRTFLRLTQPGEGTEDTKRRASFGELVPAGSDAESVESVISRLADARLITTQGDPKDPGKTSVEVAHEALIRGWGRLRQWVEADRVGLRTHRRLTEAAHEWDHAGREPSLLFAGARLATAREWAESHPGELSPLEVDFLAAGLTAEQKRKADEVAAARRLAEEAEARRQAEEERAREAEQRAQEARQYAWRQRRLRRLMAGIGGVALVFALVAAVAALEARKAAQKERVAKDDATAAQRTAEWEARKARREAGRAQSLLLATRSNEVHDKKPLLALLLAVEAVRPLLKEDINTPRLTPSEETLTQTIDILPRHRIFFTDYSNVVCQIAFAPDGKALASASSDGTVRLWDLTAPDPAARPRVLMHDGPVFHVAFAPDGKALASASSDGTVRLWDLTAPDPAARPRVLMHDRWVRRVAFAPDGKALASASWDKTVRLWDLTAPDPDAHPRVLKHDISVHHIAFAPDGKALASASSDGTVRLWDLTAADPAARPRVLKHDSQVFHVAFAPDGKALASPSGNTVRLWDLTAADPAARPRILKHEDLTAADPAARPRVPKHNWWVFQVAFAPDGKALASASSDGTVRLWDLTAPDPAARPRVLKHDSQVFHVAFAPDGKALASASGSTVRLWDLTAADPAARPRILKHDDMIWHVAFAPDGKALASASVDSTVRLWDLTAPNPTARPRVLMHDGWVNHVAFAPDGKALASASDDKTVRLWDLTAADPAARPRVLKHDGEVRQVAFAPDGKALASAYESTVRLWDLTAADPAARPRVLKHDGLVSHIAFAPDSKALASASFDTTVRLWDLTVPDPAARPCVLKHDSLVSHIAFAPDSKALASAYGRTVWLWDLTAADPATRPRVLKHDGLVQQVAFAPDGKALASASWDTTVRLWDLTAADPAARPRILKHDISVNHVAFAPDSKALASACVHGTVRLWDLTAADPAARPRVLEFGSSVQHIAFAPDGKALASASGSTVRLWDLTAADPAARPRVLKHDGEVRHVAFAPDSKMLASASSSNKTVWLWTLDLKDLIEMARNCVGRNLTFDEWREYFPLQPYRPTFPDLPVPPYNQAFKDIARNLSRAEWEEQFPGVPYRKTFPDLPEPDAEVAAAGNRAGSARP